MSERTLRCYETVNQPYARVRAALIANPLYVFRHATAAAATGTASLRVRLNAIDIGADVAIEVVSVTEELGFDEPSTIMRLAWHAKRHAELFPSMKATLELFARSPDETRLQLEGRYRPPLGKAGEMIDTVLGHQVAEASVARFLREVSDWLREELAAPAAAAAAPAETGAAADLEC